MIHDVDIAWAAGLFEGEGCFNTSVTHGRRYPRVSLQTSDRDVLERFCAIVGVGHVHKRKLTGIAHHRPMWDWYTSNRREVAMVGDLFWPYLGERRRERLMHMWEHTDDMERPWFAENRWAAKTVT